MADGGLFEEALRRSMGYRPADPVTSRDGVYSLLAALVRAGDAPSVEAILRGAPQLGLEGLSAADD